MTGNWGFRVGRERTVIGRIEDRAGGSVMLQNWQAQVLPRIMNVAVPRLQHSCWLGQCALWQTVCSAFLDNTCRTAP
jgi:hypothetical protein